MSIESAIEQLAATFEMLAKSIENYTKKMDSNKAPVVSPEPEKVVVEPVETVSIPDYDEVSTPPEPEKVVVEPEKKAEQPKPKKASKAEQPKPKKASKGDTEQETTSPYALHPDEVSGKDELKMMARQEFKRLVLSKGEKIANNLLMKFKIKQISELKDSDVASFMTDAAIMTDEGESGIVTPELTKKMIQDKLKELATIKGHAAARGVLSLLGLKTLKELEEEDYQFLYDSACDELEG